MLASSWNWHSSVEATLLICNSWQNSEQHWHMNYHLQRWVLSQIKNGVIPHHQFSIAEHGIMFGFFADRISMWRFPYEIVCGVVTEYNIVFKLWLAKIHLAFFDLFLLFACHVQATLFTTASHDGKMTLEQAPHISRHGCSPSTCSSNATGSVTESHCSSRHKREAWQIFISSLDANRKLIFLWTYSGFLAGCDRFLWWAEI